MCSSDIVRKTFIAWYTLNAQQIHGPFLVLVPLSTLSNWAKEFRKCLPDLNVIVRVCWYPCKPRVQRYVPLGASVADLYAGAGVITLSLAATRKCRSVRCIEINKESKLSFEKTVARLPNIVDSSISWHHADTSKLRHRRGKSETTRAQYINTKDVRLTISTWNVAGRVPDENLDIDDWISSEEPSDIYMFNGMAELSMTIANLPDCLGNTFSGQRRLGKYTPRMNLTRSALK